MHRKWDPYYQPTYQPLHINKKARFRVPRRWSSYFIFYEVYGLKKLKELMKIKYKNINFVSYTRFFDPYL